MLLPMMDKKKIVSIVLGEEKPQEQDLASGLEPEFMPAYEAAAKDVIESIKSDDPKLMVKALKGFFKLCEKEEDYYPDTEE
jgi:hypothetical protein